MNVSVSYDQTFKTRFGNNSGNVAKSIMDQVQNLFNSTPMPYKIQMNFTSFQEIPLSLQASKPSL